MKKILILFAGCFLFSAMSYADSFAEEVGNDTGTVIVDDANYDNSFDVAVPVTAEYTAVNYDITYTGVYYVSNATGFINPVRTLRTSTEISYDDMDRAGNNSDYTKEARPINFVSDAGGPMKVFSI